MSDIAVWLDNLDLGKYAGVFADNEIDFNVLPQLTEEDIRELGLPLGPRRKLLTAIAALQSGSDRKAIQQRSDPDTTAEPSSSPQAERRQLTVMFFDLVGSTALSGQLDPEELRALILVYQNAVAGEISRYEGYVARYMGDGVLVYFGWPRTHEDEVERAVHAGLAVSATVGKLRTPDGQPLATRIGIATGLVVVGGIIGEGASEEQAVVGETPNLAARLQRLAEPGTVLISAATRRLCAELFELQSLFVRGQLDAFSATQ